MNSLVDTGSAGPLEPMDIPVGASTALTPMQMAYQLIARGADIGAIEKMLELSGRLAADEARRAFDAALAAAKAEIPVIRKNRHVGFDHKNDDNKTEYWHEDLGEIAKTIDPILGKHGLSYRYRSAQAEGRVILTCVLSHRDGHFEETVLSASPDASGKKNSIQQVGSAITYLQRYTLKMALGLAAARDDDGAQVGSSDASATDLAREQVEELLDLIERSGTDIEKFCIAMKIEAVPELHAKNFEAAKNMLLTKILRKQQGAQK